MASLQVEYKEDILRVKTEAGIWEFANDQENKKVCLVFLRAWQDPETGKPRYRFQEIADAFGYADRRNVNNYWREFLACGGRVLDFVLRRRKVDLNVVEAVKEELRGDITAPLSPLCERTNRRLGRCDLTEANIRCALERIPCTVIRKEVMSRWEAGAFHPKEEVVLEEAMAALEQGDCGVRERARELLSGLGVSPNEEREDAIVQQSQWEAVHDLLRPDLPVSEIPERTRQMVFAMNLYFWNVPLSRIGLWLGRGKSTIYGWVVGLAVALWAVVGGWVTTRVRGVRLYVDEKWLKIGGKWYYWFTAIDADTQIPLFAHLLPTRSKWACRWFLLKLKALGKHPQVIITDGLAGYLSSIPKVFGKAKHLLCLFHHQQGVTRWVKKHLGSLKDEEAEQVKKQMKKVAQAQDTRTVKRRLKRLEKQDAQNGWGIGPWIARCWNNLKRLIPSLRSNQYPKTTNTIERFFRSFQRFYKTRCGFHSVESAKRELILFMVMYLFTQQAQTGKAPIETIVPQASRMPFYQLVNDPFGCGITSTCQGDDKGSEEMATEPLKLAA